MDVSGLLAYGVFFLTLAGIYAILTLGLNIQWGYAGMLNIGVGAFFFGRGLCQHPGDRCPQ